jgi:hypothetical protein
VQSIILNFMQRKPSTKIKDPDLEKVLPALLRAAKQARRIAAATNTPLVIFRNGKTVKLSVVEPRRQESATHVRAYSDSMNSATLLSRSI